MGITIIVRLPRFMRLVIINTDGSLAVFRALVDANLFLLTSFGDSYIRSMGFDQSDIESKICLVVDLHI